MRPMKFGLLAALAAAVLAPAAMVAAPKDKPAVSDSDRKEGMKEGPAVVQAAGLPCQLSDARLVGKDPKSGASFYEVACTNAMGFVVQKAKDGSASAYSCLETATPGPDGKPSSLHCILPANSDPKTAMGPALAKGGVQCTPENARAMGVNADKKSVFEVACQGGSGYLVVTATPFDPSKDVELVNCNELDDQPNAACKLTDKATRLAVVDRYAQQAAAGCAVKDRRYIGKSKDGSDFFEASCQDGKGYIFKADSKGAVAQTWDCAKAQGILGGCTLTDAREAATQQAGLYTRLAKAAGSNCDVERYAAFATASTDDVVELVCKDGTGAVGIFKTGGAGSQVLDCGHALAAGYRCSLSKDTAGFAALTADLKKYNYNSCTVSNARPAAKSTKGTVFVEVACADGLTGYMIEYQTAPKVTSVGATGCRFAGGCELPGNKS